MTDRARGLFCLVIGVWPFGACSSTETPTSVTETGSVQVTASTTGSDLDTEYTVAIGSLTGNVSANGSVTIQNVGTGSASVQLGDIAANCSVTGSNPLSVTVVASQTTTAAFSVTCAQLAAANVDSIITTGIESMESTLFAAANVESVSDLDGFSFEEANALFNEALSLSPSNDTASFGAAVTTILMLEDDPDVRALVDAWDAWVEEDAISPLARTLTAPAIDAVRQPLVFPHGLSTTALEEVAYAGTSVLVAANAPSLTHDPPPSITDHQTVLREVVEPALIEAANHIAEITNTSFTFTVTEAMQGETTVDADPLELDFTEIYAIAAGLELGLAAVDIATAYTFTPNPLTADGFVDAMTPGSTFLTLASGGATALNDALTRIESAAPLLLAGLDFLESEVDDQTNDIIKYDPTGVGDGLSQQDVTEARDLIQDTQGALSSPTVVTVNAGKAEEFSFTLDARTFFVDPIEDFKTLLPSYEVFTATEEGETVPVFRWTELNLDDWTFPDPTFNGILPGMTKSGLFDFELDEVFFDWSLTGGYYQLITIDGQDCRALVESGGQGCPVGGSYYYDATIDLDGSNAMPRVWIELHRSDFSSVYSTGSYDVVDNQDGTHTVSMDTVIQDGSETPLVLDATFTDMPGFDSTDQFFRRRGGSSIEFSYMGSVWVFEKQD